MRPRGEKQSPEVLFGKEVARLRKRLGISQEELAFRAEVHRTYISQLERGLKSPTMGVMMKVAQALKTRPSKLIETAEN